MADHSKPLTTSTYANFVTELDARFDDLAVGLDPAVTTATNVPTNSIRWSSANNKWQKWSGSVWNDLSTTYVFTSVTTTGLNNTGNTTLGDSSADTITLNGTVQGGVVISGNTTADGLRITQTGTGNAFVVEDSTSPDATPFVIKSDGLVGIGIASPSAKLDVSNFNGRNARIGGLQIGGTSPSADAGNNIASSGSYYDGSTFTATATTASAIQFGNGVLNFYTDTGLTAGSTFALSYKMQLDGSGKLGIGGAPTNGKVSIVGSASTDTNTELAIERSSSATTIQNAPNITFRDGTANNTVTIQAGAGNLQFWRYTGAWVENMRINGGGALIIGAGNGGQTLTGNTGLLQVESPNGAANISLVRNTASGTAGQFLFGKSRGAVAGGVTAVIAGDGLGSMIWHGTDGTGYVQSSYISSGVESAVSTGIVPAYISFATRDTVGNLAERVRISSAGSLSVLGYVGNATIDETGARLKFTRAGANYISATMAGGSLNFGSNGTESQMVFAAGNLGIGKTPSSSFKLDIDSGSIIPIQTTTTQLTSHAYYCKDDSASGMNINYYKIGGSPATGDSLGLLRFYGEDSALNVTEYLRITVGLSSPTNGAENGAFTVSAISAGAIATKLQIANGSIRAIDAYTLTTASAANMNVDTAGVFSRSTSSIQYKIDVEDLAEVNSANIYNMRPVWYRSTCDKDNKKWSWYGLIAEEVAELDPRLVHWGYAQDQYDISYVENDGQKEEVKTLKEDAELQPEGVQYDRLTVLLIQEMKVLKAEMEELKAKVAALEAA